MTSGNLMMQKSGGMAQRQLLLLQMLASSSLAPAAAAASCATASDCNLNGDCIAGACVCDKGWRGSPTCGVLTLGAVDKSHRPGISNSSYATWGASPIKGADGKWRVFHAQMSHHCGIFQAWMTNSFIGRSVSTSGDVGGPYLPSVQSICDICMWYLYVEIYARLS